MRPIGGTHHRLHFHKILGCIAAILSLCVSAVSACACSHHQPHASFKTPSCHSSSQVDMAMEAVDVRLGDSRVDVGCTCFSTARISGAVSKSESGSTSASKAVTGTILGLTAIERATVSFNDAPIDFEMASLQYSWHILHSGPSRAPPRL